MRELFTIFIFSFLFVPKFSFAESPIVAQYQLFGQRDFLEVFELIDTSPVILDNVGLNNVFLSIPIRYRKSIMLKMPLQVKDGEKYGKINAQNRTGIFYGHYFEFEEGDQIKFYAQGAKNSSGLEGARGELDIWYFAGDEDGLQDFCILDYAEMKRLISCGKLPNFADIINLHKSAQNIQVLNFEYSVTPQPDKEHHHFNFRIKKYSKDKIFRSPTEQQIAQYLMYVKSNIEPGFAFFVRPDLSYDIKGHGVIIEQYLDDDLIVAHAKGAGDDGLISFSTLDTEVSIKPLKNGRFAIALKD